MRSKEAKGGPKQVPRRFTSPASRQGTSAPRVGPAKSSVRMRKSLELPPGPRREITQHSIGWGHTLGCS
jgi:hypothetical protein